MDLIYPATAVLNGHARVPVALVYDRADPWAITFTGGGQQWLFARELLATGCIEPAGDGDVIIRPDTGGTGDHVLLILSGPDGAAELAVPRGTVESLLDAADALVPAGCERLDWDHEWSSLTGGPAA